MWSTHDFVLKWTTPRWIFVHAYGYITFSCHSKNFHNIIHIHKHFVGYSLPWYISFCVCFVLKRLYVDYKLFWLCRARPLSCVYSTDSLAICLIDMMTSISRLFVRKQSLPSLGLPETLPSDIVSGSDFKILPVYVKCIVHWFFLRTENGVSVYIP